MNEQLKFCFHDLITAPRKAFSFKRIGAIGFFMFMALAVYNLLNWLAAWVSAVSFQEGSTRLGLWWMKFGILPDFRALNFPWYGQILEYMGFVLAFFLLMLGIYAASRVTFEELKGNFFFGTVDAIKSAFNNWKKVVFSPVLILFLAAAIIIGGLVEALIFKIPYFGEIFNSFIMFLIIPFTLIVLFIGIVGIISLRFTAPIAAVIEDDFFEVVYQLFSSVSSQPARLIGYSIYNSLQAIVGFFIWLWSLYQGFQIFYKVFAIVAGDKIFALVNNAYYYIQKLFPQWQMIDSSPLFAPLQWIATPSWQKPLSVSATMDFASYALTFILFLMLLAGVAYYFSILSVGDTLAYLIIRYKKDDEDLIKLAQEEEDFDEEVSEEMADQNLEEVKNESNPIKGESEL